MRFRDRAQAAAFLGERLSSYRSAHPLVLGLPRGGVPMARIVADAIGGDLDVVLVRKLRAPDQPELAIGAVDEQGHVVETDGYDAVPAGYLREEVRAQTALLAARRTAYRRVARPVSPAGRVVVLVDDGVATGATMEAAVHAVRAQGARRVVVAIGVAPASTVARLRTQADEVVCLRAIEPFGAVGLFFEDFSEVTDDDVIAALAASGRPPFAAV